MKLKPGNLKVDRLGLKRRLVATKLGLLAGIRGVMRLRRLSIVTEIDAAQDAPPDNARWQSMLLFLPAWSASRKVS